MLNLPGEDLVLQEDFLNLLDRLDVCLDYLKANVSWYRVIRHRGRPVLTHCLFLHCLSATLKMPSFTSCAFNSV